MSASVPSGNSPTRVHFSGIGGTAMVAGARLALELGCEVRGSDNPLYPPTSHMVSDLGVATYEGYAAANLDWQPDLVVIGNALSRGNPEVEAVLQQRLPYVSLAEWLKTEVLRARRPIVISGTHGKTTTSALTAFLMDRCEFNPGYLVGGQMLDFANSSRLGAAGAPFVIEGDEYDSAFFDKRAKFLHYLPETAVVTSIEFDHGDIYRDIAEIELAFQRMLRQIPADGLLLLCGDDARAAALREHAFCPVQTYGLGDGNDWQCTQATRASGAAGQRLDVQRHGEPFGQFEVAMAGAHNARNALAAMAITAHYGASAKDIECTLPAFKGIRRRMEVICERDGVVFVDDFAHHPTAIRETIEAARQRWQNARIVAAFEPRTNTTRTAKFQGELAEALKDADVVWIGPIARKEQLAEGEALDRNALAEAIRSSNREAHCADDAESIVDGLSDYAGTDTVVLLMSNGAFGGIYGQIKERFAE